jgi:hypothetical protein
VRASVCATRCGLRALPSARAPNPLFSRFRVCCSRGHERLHARGFQLRGAEIAGDGALTSCVDMPKSEILTCARGGQTPQVR